MRILFIHHYNFYEPLGIMSLSAMLKRGGHVCELLDLKLDKNHIRTITKFNPDIIAYSITTNNWKRYHLFNLELKKQFNFFSVFGGPHCTFFPELLYENGVDAICIGEGEYAFLEFADALEKGKEFTQISNFWIKREGRFYKNDLRPLIEDLDELPFPDRILINKYNHYRMRSRVRTMTSRGCPYNCSYCFNHAYKELYKGKGKIVRHRSPSNVIEEVKQLKEIYHPVNIEFHDDIFILDKPWLSTFLDLYNKEKISIPFEINIRADLVTPEIVKMLKEGGCYCVQFGIETGNVRLRNKLLNRNISDEQIIETARLFRNAGIKTNTYNMTGLPGETINDSFSTLLLNQKCRPTYAMNTIFHPYPRNKITEISMFNGVFNGDYANYGKNLFYGKSVIVSKDRRKMMRLHYLFALGVSFPLLVPVIRLLTNLPLSKLYQSLYFLYRVYVIMFVFKRLQIRELFLRN